METKLMLPQDPYRQDLLLGALYGELSGMQQQAFERLCLEDAELAAVWAQLRETLQLLDKRELQDPGEEFWGSFWDALENRLEEAPKPRGRMLPAWSYQALAAAAILVLGIFIGQSWLKPEVAPVSPDPAMQALAVEARAETYLERSRVLLIGLVNLETANDLTNIDLAAYQKVSNGLVNEGQQLKQVLQKPGQARLRELVNDLEVILLQIANLQEEDGADAIQMVQSGVDRRGLLLKINLEELRRIGEENPPQKEMEI